MSSAGPRPIVENTPRSGAARFELREATAEAHARVDDLFSRLNLANPADYIVFLRAQAAAHLAVEGALDRAGAGDVIADWAERRRAAALGRDLQSLGIQDLIPMEPPTFAGGAQILGGAYVLEGSRLGGALLRRSVLDDLPVEFLSAGSPELWRGLVALLDRRLNTPVLVAEATESALSAFAVFERSAKLALETNRP